jgi:hypothetical protein
MTAVILRELTRAVERLSPISITSLIPMMLPCYRLPLSAGLEKPSKAGISICPLRAHRQQSNGPPL